MLSPAQGFDILPWVPKDICIILYQRLQKGRDILRYLLCIRYASSYISAFSFFIFNQTWVFCFCFKLFILNWSIADQQCCDSFSWTAKGLSHTYICIHSLLNSPPIQAAT